MIGGIKWLTSLISQIPSMTCLSGDRLGAPLVILSSQRDGASSSLPITQILSSTQGRVLGVFPVQEEPRQVEHVVSANVFNPAMNDSENERHDGDSSAGESFVPQGHNSPLVSVQEESGQLEHVVSDSDFNPAVNDNAYEHHVDINNAGDNLVESLQYSLHGDTENDTSSLAGVTCANDGGTMLTSSSVQTVSASDNQVVVAASTIPEVGGNRHSMITRSKNGIRKPKVLFAIFLVHRFLQGEY
ncbi:hypothetical protein V6N11_069973 [Hibiscus sabdariffa]|uniref:Uncharacterized protein n=1 Tax=Hibiscus sabdariffa TaxID=183260 RepID=A0ABR2QDQ2_9ROSI